MEMQMQLENNTLTLYLEGRIDSNNAAQFEKEVMDRISQAPGAEIALDAGRLQFISSAGLRVLMKLCKQAKKVLPVWNVSSEIYEIFEVTGFTDLFDVHKALREVSIEGCELIGSGANGQVYRLTKDEMIKVFRPAITLDEIEAEREASRKAFLLGVPCAIAFDTVKVDDRYGTVYETLNAATLTERIRENPNRVEELAEKSVKLLKELHETEVPEGHMPNADCPLHNYIDRVAGDFTPEELKQMHALYDSIPAMNRFVHNDYHAKNIMEDNEGELLLIDLGDAGAGNPLFDLIHCYMIYNLMGSGMKETKDDDMSFIGLTYGELRRYWKVFSETYFGSAERANTMNTLLKPYGLMMYYTSAMSYPALPVQYHAVYAEKMRNEVLSHYDELLGSLTDTLDVCIANNERQRI